MSAALQTAPSLFASIPTPSKPPLSLVPHHSGVIGTPQQEAFWREVVHGKTHIILQARAGSGKSFSICHAGALSLEQRPSLRIGYCAYNKEISEDLKKKIPRGAESSTMHSLGFRAIIAHLGRKPAVEDQKSRIILKEMLSPDELDARKRVPKALGRAVSDVVSMCKSYLLEGSTTDIDFICERHDIELAPILASLAGTRQRTAAEVRSDAAFRQRVYDLVPGVIQRSIEMLTTIDMDDMIWLPLMWNMGTIPQFDLLFVDECQDLNKARRKMAFKMLTKHGRLICVGDDRQAIYGFTGADTRSMENIRLEMEESRRNVVEMPLTWTRRCPQSIVALAREIVPDIEAMPEAPQGAIQHVDNAQAAAMMVPGDMVLCRCNAPLVGMAHQLLRAEKKALLRGKDLSKPILDLMEALGATNVTEMGELLKSYQAHEMERLHDANKSATVIAAFQDKCATLEVLMEGCTSRSEIERKIKRIFEEKDPDGAVILSSAHSSKGLEAQTVWILRPDLMPHPAALKKGRADDIRQEENLRYVAITRSMNRLIFVDADKPSEPKPIPAGIAASLSKVRDKHHGESGELEPIDEDEEPKEWAERARLQLHHLCEMAPFDAPAEYLNALDAAKLALPR